MTPQWPVSPDLFSALALSHPLMLGTLFFSLSWIAPRRTVLLAGTPQRRQALLWLGIAGSALILLVVSLMSTTTILARLSIDATGASPAPTLLADTLHRISALTSTVLVLAIAVLALRRDPPPAPGLRAIAPRLPWYNYAPRAALRIGATAAVLLACTSVWQGALSRNSEFLEAFKGGPLSAQTVAPPSVFGWGIHAPVIVLLALLVIVLILALAADANRPRSAVASAQEVRAARGSAASLLCRIALSGLLLGLGTVWLQSSEQLIVVSASETSSDGSSSGMSLFIGDSGGLIELLHILGFTIQGIGAALLLRLAADTWRAGRTLKRLHRADGPDPDTVLASPRTLA